MIAIGVLAAVVVALVATSISAAAPPGVLKAADLLAGQNTDAGDIFVWTEAGNVKIEIALDAGWCMSESHVAAASSLAGIPQTKQGSPIPGKFPLSETYSPCEQAGDTFSFPISGTGGVGANPYIAVHAVVWNEASHTTTAIVSEPGRTALTAGGTAVAATEPTIADYPNCPVAGDDDSTPSLWDTYAKLPGNLTPDWGDADWIWNAPYPVYPKNVTGEVVGFNDSFSLVGLPISGSLTITGDNAYSAKVNGGAAVQAQLGPGFPGTLLETVVPGAPQTGNWGVASQGWQSVETYPLSGLKTGANTLAITAANEYLSNGSDPAGPVSDSYLNAWDPSGGSIVDDSNGATGCINPAGLIYKLTAESYTQSATGWASGTAFQGGNWATYLHPNLNPNT